MRKLWLTAAAALAIAPAALASGYGFYEQDAEATGQAGAVIARADNASAGFYNPAGLATQKGSSFSAGGTIVAYSAWGRLETPLVLRDCSAGVAQPSCYAGYKSYAAGTRYDAKAGTFFPANVHLNYKLKDNMALGFSSFAPFALGTTWGSDGPFKYMATNADVRIIDLSPNFAMSMMGGKFSWAIGLDYYRGSATLDQVFDLGQKSSMLPSPPYPANTPAVVFPRGDNWSHVSAKGNKLGGHVGFQWKPNDTWRLGLVYRTKAELELKGNAEFYTVAGNVSGAVVIPGQSVKGLFPDQPAKTMLPVPATGGVGIAWMGKKWEVEFDGTYQGWSAFESLNLDFSRTTCLNTAVGCSSILTDKRVREDWEDTWAYRLGAKWNGWDGGYLSLGYVYDQSPVPAETLRSLLPDGARTGLTAGVGTSYEHLKFDFSVMMLNFKKGTSQPGAAVNNDPNSATFNQPLGAGITEHMTSETLHATYQAKAWLFGMNIGYRF